MLLLYVKSKEFSVRICCKMYRFCNKFLYIFFDAIYPEKSMKFLDFLNILNFARDCVKNALKTA